MNAPSTTRPLPPSNVAAFIEHTLLKPEAVKGDVERLCEEAVRYRFYGVCVHAGRVERARTLLEDSDIKVVTVVGYPFGATDGDVKRYETETAIDLGAQEIDMVMNIGLFLDGEEAKVLREITDVVDAAQDIPVKVILETCLLTREQTVRAAGIIRHSGAAFVKTSTGFARAGAQVGDIKRIRETLGPQFGIKASGGIRDLKTALSMLDAGANRLGTSSSVRIMEEWSRNPIQGWNGREGVSSSKKEG